MATSGKPVLPGLLAERAAEEPESPALTMEGAASVTYGEWNRRSDAVAWGLARREVGPGHRVALVFDRATWVDFAVSYAGVHKTGAAAVPVDAGVGPLELARVLDDCRASGLVTPDPSSMSRSLTPRGSNFATWTRGELEAGHDGETFPVPSRPAEPVDISYLSGSLRRPVGVGRGEDEIISVVDAQHPPPPAPVSGSPSLLHFFPPDSDGGREALWSALRGGAGPVLTLPTFDADRFCALTAERRVTAWGLPPVLAELLLDSGRPEHHDLSSLTRVVLSGGRAPLPLLSRLAAMLPGAEVLSVGTVAGAAAVRTPFRYNRSRPGSIGRPFGGGQVRVTDEAGRELPAGETGRVWLAPPQGQEERWLPTPEVGFVDDGFVYLVAARSEVVRVRGSTVSTAEVASPGSEERDETRDVVVAVWERFLSRDGIGPDDDFFDLGGDQPAAVEVLHLLEDAFEVRLSMATFLESPTPAGLAAAVEERREAAGASPSPVAPVAFSQEGMLWQEQFAPGCQNLPPLARRYRGPLDVAALERALGEIVRRHEPLRSTFELRDGRPVQVASDPGRPPLAVRDLSDLDPGDREAEVAAVLSDAARPFDLVRGPMFEPTLLVLGPDDHVLMMRVHHSVYDDWSVSVFRRELSAFYTAFSAGRGLVPTELPLGFTDFSRAQRRRLAGRAGTEEMAYWRRQLAGAPVVLQLPVDDPDLQAGAPQPSPEPVSVDLPPAVATGLRALARRERATLFMTVLTAFQVLLHRYTGQPELVLASVVANRNRTELEEMIGCFTKKVLLRLRWAGDETFPQLLALAREVVLGAVSHQDLAFETVLQDVLGPPAARHGMVPHVAVMFQGVTPQAEEVVLPGVATTGFETSATTRRAHFMAGEEGDAEDVAPQPWGGGLYLGTFLILSVVESGDGVSLVARGAFHRPAVEGLLGAFEALVADLVADPSRPVSELSLGGEAHEEEPVGVEVQACAHRLFEEQAGRSPSAAAVIAPGEVLTYAELDARAGTLAQGLRGMGVGRGAVVGVCLPPSPECVVAVLAVWKAGAAYLGLDPHDSDEHLDSVLGDASVEVVLAPPSLRRSVVERRARLVVVDAQDPGPGRDQPAPPAGVGADDPAVVFYGAGPSAVTSGVVLAHRSVAGLLAGLRRGVHQDEELGDGPGPLRVCLSAAVTDDAFLRQLVAVLDGHALHAVQDGGGAEVVSLVRDGDVDLVHCGAEELVELLSAGLEEALATRGQEAPEPVIVAGSRAALGADLWDRLTRLQGARPHHLYGPPECGFGATLGSSGQAARRVTVGQPMSGVTARILDRSGRTAPAGAVGELHLGGSVLALGYVGGGEATSDRFVAGPGAGGRAARLYQTGQLARQLPDGRIELLGAKADHVDLLGFGIDRTRLEAALRRCPGVAEAAVTLHEDQDAGPSLVAYVVPAEEGLPTLARLRAFLWSMLPGYAWPAAVVLTPRLPRVEDGTPPPPDGIPAGETPEQQLLASLWADVLAVDRVQPAQNYWQSFSFLDVLARARQAGLTVRSEQVTRNRTVEALATDLAAERVASTPEQ